MLAPQVVMLSDGGGAEKVGPFVEGLHRRTADTLAAVSTVVDGGSALVLRLDGRIDGGIAFRVEHGRITGLDHVRNPRKPTHIGAKAPLALR